MSGDAMATGSPGRIGDGVGWTLRALGRRAARCTALKHLAPTTTTRTQVCVKQSSTTPRRAVAAAGLL